MLLRITTVAILLDLFIQDIQGFEKVIEVNESDVHVVSYNEDTLAANAIHSGITCCPCTFENSCDSRIYGNCSCLSLHSVLDNLTSNVLINLTTDVVLSSIIPLVDLTNITITGHNSPSVNCNTSGGLHFISCHNCIIEGITWNGCGGASNVSDGNSVPPVLQLFNSSNITIRNCLFQHSIGQAIVLSEMIGDVYIDHCNFLSSNRYEGHGTAIHYSSNDMLISSLIFLIASCNFFYNENAKSVLYFGQSSAKLSEYMNLQNSKFCYNRAVPIYLSNQRLYISGNTEFDGNVAENGGGIFISNHSDVIIHRSARVNFTHNRASNGGAIFLTNHSSIVFKEYSTSYHSDTLGDQYLSKSFITVKFYNNTVHFFGQDIYAHNSNVTVGDAATVTFNGNDCHICTSSAVYANYHSTITFEGDSTVSFDYDYVDSIGGVMYIDFYSTVTFQGNSKVSFHCITISNSTIYIAKFSTVSFKETSSVEFIGNHVIIGVLHIDDHSNITFQGNSIIKFTDNHALGNGGAIYIGDHCGITFEGNSTVNFAHNMAGNNGGAIYSDGYSTITFEGNSTVTFSYNTAGNGAAMYFNGHSTITFQGKSSVTFHDNQVTGGNAGVMYMGSHRNKIIFQGNSMVNFTYNYGVTNGGVMYIHDSSSVTFKGNCTVAFTNNYVDINGGVMYINDFSFVTFQEKSQVTFIDNYATNGGVMYINHDCTITFDGNSAVTFVGNSASNGGVMYTDHYSAIRVQGDCIVTFNDNQAENGGVIHLHVRSTFSFQGNSTVLFQENSTVTFNGNHAGRNGGVIYGYAHNTCIKFEGNCRAKFMNNSAHGKGGVAFVFGKFIIIFKGNTLVELYNNKAINYGGEAAIVSNLDEIRNNGGVWYMGSYSTMIFEGNSTVKFNDNHAVNNGGVIYILLHSTITFEGNSTIYFSTNKVIGNGGSLYVGNNSTINFEENSKVIFNSNMADSGGTIFCESSSITFDGNSFVKFNNNTASRDGGAIYLNDNSNFTQFNYSNIAFHYNRASDYGSAIYALFKNTFINYNSYNIHFKDNFAGTITKPVYVNVPISCGHRCLYHGINITNKNDSLLATSPSKLILYNSAKCIKGNDTNTDTYYLNNVMLGQLITFHACVLDYYDQPTETGQFKITGMNHQDYNISGSKYISVSCNHPTQEFSIIGNLHSNNSYNYSLKISLYFTRISESQLISVNLIVELSQCHHGFWYSNKSQKCECYHADNIISCTGGSSTIKRNYWFGSVSGKPTVTSCPNDYCNFTCCEISNGIYHLSPARANQCNQHRSGTACGNCERGYSLSFDSPDCVRVNKCTVGQTILVTTLSLLYWIAVVVAVFVMMYFKVTLGSLYAIVYYYSVVDILLGQVLFISNGLYTLVSFMSSFAKLIPQFLGVLCLVRNMSGVDQQFVHYVHPVVIFLILIGISVLARRSRKISSFISRGIIHFICFLLLLSYTSVASTSLLLLRPLTFLDIDNVYTYLSPDIEYFHGRHFAYVAVAIIFTIVIVIGFPLLLLLEPFLNSKINFIKIKPLLDQFQGCYKDKYRCFAGYYMICRLVIILFVIVKISDDFASQYLLISSCALMQLIHILVRPYVSTIHNIFDGIILQLIVIISVLPMIDFVDNYDETFVLVIVYLFVFLPLASFIAMKVWINRNIFQNTFKYSEICTTNPQGPAELNEFGIILDDNMRRNAIVVDM